MILTVLSGMAEFEREAIKRIKAEKEALGKIARCYNVSRWTISRLQT